MPQVYEVRDVWERQAALADTMLDWKHREWPFFKEHVIDPLMKAAFEAFQKVPAEETARIIEAQMMAKILARIEGEIDAIIQQGTAARHYLSTATLEGEDVDA